MAMMVVPPKEDRTQVSFYEPGKDFGIAVDGKAVMQDKVHVACDVDFYPILYSAGLLDAEYIEWFDGDLDSPTQQAVDRRANTDHGDEALRALLPANPYIQSQSLKALYGDAMMGYLLGMPFCVDYNLSPVVKFKQQKLADQWKESLPYSFYDCWLNMEYPDLTSYSWDEVRRIRESAVGIDFRRMIDTVVNEVEDAMPNVSSHEEIQEILNKEFHSELRDELLRRRTTGFGLLVNIGLNLIPYAVIPSVVKDVREYGKEKASWISLLT